MHGTNVWKIKKIADAVRSKRCFSRLRNLQIDIGHRDTKFVPPRSFVISLRVYRTRGHGLMTPRQYPCFFPCVPIFFLGAQLNRLHVHTRHGIYGGSKERE